MMNKKLTKTGIFTVAFSLCLIAACKKDFLDQKTLSVLNEQAVFSDSTTSVQFLLNRYGDLQASWNPSRFGNAGMEAATDEAEPSTNLTSYAFRMSSGSVNPSNADKTIWTMVFTQTRAINILLKNLKTIPIGQAEKNRWEAEAHFLRAWYSFMLLKHYGGFPMIGDKIFTDDEKIDIPRNTYEECVNFISAECDKAVTGLPPSIPVGSSQLFGRATIGAALALKARLLLYAASPLVNGPRPDDPGHLVSYASPDNERWKKAADAALAVINLNQYSLYRAATPFFQRGFSVTAGQLNPEQILIYLRASTTANNQFLERLWNPISRSTSGSVTCFPYQELVDSFGMINGLPIGDAASGYNPSNMYANRDPRLGFTIMYNGSLRFYGGFGDQPVNTYTGVVPSGTAAQSSASVDGIYTALGTKTGYYCYKMCDNNTVSGGSENAKNVPLIRYAEILLIAAEATNEYSGPNAQIYTWLRDIRSRAGLTPANDYGLKSGMSKDEMRIVIQNERRVELAFEEHRYWDVRRWKIAPQVEDKEMHGMEATRAASGAITYKAIVVRKHVFTNAMYFWPIPQSELTKSPALQQNPGY